MVEVSSENNKSPLRFIKAVAKYFMDFLETDFHRRRNPKRNVQNRNSDNLLIGLNLNKYPAFNDLVLKQINHNFQDKIVERISKGVFRTSIPKNLLDIVKLELDNINSDEIKKVTKNISLEVKKSTLLFEKNYENALSLSLDKSSEIIKKNFVLEFLKNLKEPLESLDLGSENNLFLMEEELTEVLLSLIKNKISELIKVILTKENTDVFDELKDIFSVSDVKQSVASFFDDYKVTDLYAEIYEMDRNKSILDKQEFYLYFYDITFNKIKYPVFYIPFEVTKEDEDLFIEFDSQIYINKRALEYIAQERNVQTEKKGTLKSIGERIIYINQEKDGLKDTLNNILKEMVNFFELNGSIDINKLEKQTAKSALVSITNSRYVSLFDKSDEALVNDYEEILKLLDSGDNILAQAFNKLIDDFIHNEPTPFDLEIGEEWDDLETPDKLVFNSPIPMNSEQLQILKALQKEKCKYMIVEGPPGTGKSHTITAIAFDSILKNKSVLVLSDKKEALDVVEDKITNTLNKVRFDKNFQNPILRLGRAGSTYSQILAPKTVNDIIINYKAVRKDYNLIEEGIDKISNSLKDDISAEIIAYNEVDINEVKEFVSLKDYLTNKIEKNIYEELLLDNDSIIEIDEIRKIYYSITNNLNSEDKDVIWGYITYFIKKKQNIFLIKNLLLTLQNIIFLIKQATDKSNFDIAFLDDFRHYDDDINNYLSELFLKYKKLNYPIVGYLFTKNQVKTLDEEFKNKFPLTKINELHENLGELEKMLNFFEILISLKQEIKAEHINEIDFLDLIFDILKSKDFDQISIRVENSIKDLDYLAKTVSKYPMTFDKYDIKVDSLNKLSKQPLIKLSDYDFEKVIRYLYLFQKLIKSFKNIPNFDYATQKGEIEKYVTTKMTYLLDGRLINFYQNNKATANVLKQIIKTKQKFPRNEFNKLKEAFPCILASIRDYAEYIPLEPDIFDLVIIDEASQVSIAQAFPALLRSKRVLILGDNKQFSNVKSNQAKSDTNREYTNNLKSIFIKNISGDSTKLIKLEKFNIKTSILDFFSFINNFHIPLLKHFRGYKEIISYSDKYFYKNLQVMKIRAKPIDEVIKFTIIKHDGKSELIPNSNTLEIDFIIKELLKFKNTGSTLTVGIITPHTNQQKLIVEKINKLPEKDYFFEELKLKVMTFDTCQGEERDIIFYSMVATESDDKLWGIFIKDLSSINIEEDGKIKAQRLNVGFSRAKEQIHFVLSKPVDKFNGSIREALLHYSSVLSEAKKEKDVSLVDKKSKMEPEVLNWFYQTEFWNTHKDHTEFFPQFELGAYLRQLDKTYTHPAYKVDFLLIFNDEKQEAHKIIIEYDGFFEHFKDTDNINKYNYAQYYSEQDVYREKVLESYGYKFIRINKFNIGKNPISTLNQRIYSLIKDNSTQYGGLLTKIHSTVESINNGEMKECPNCKELKSTIEFKDKDLITGYGRFCNTCKSKKHKTPIYASQSTSSVLCPVCKSGMILRTGRYGRFYGCSRFPYCRGTRRC